MVMKKLNSNELHDYVDIKFSKYFYCQEKLLREATLDDLFWQNPYLFVVKKPMIAGQLVESLLDAFLFSWGEKFFGDFLEELAIFIAGKTCGGHKSAATGIDLEFINNGIHYVVSIKSGPNWGNSSQQNKLQQDLQKAVTTIKQSQFGANVQAVLGICYGKTKTSYVKGYLKVVGQNFWYLISENKNLYTDIIEPISYQAQQHNDTFSDEKARVTNQFTREFIDSFCDETGAVDWAKLVEWNSGNFDLDKFMAG